MLSSTFLHKFFVFTLAEGCLFANLLVNQFVDAMAYLSLVDVSFLLFELLVDEAALRSTVVDGGLQALFHGDSMRGGG